MSQNIGGWKWGQFLSSVRYIALKSVNEILTLHLSISRIEYALGTLSLYTTNSKSKNIKFDNKINVSEENYKNA